MTVSADQTERFLRHNPVGLAVDDRWVRVGVRTA